MTNLCLTSDSYKQSHYLQYPPGTTKVYSYLESRGGKFQEVVFHGLQYILKRYVVGSNQFTGPVSPSHVKEAKDILAQHFGNPALFNEEGWLHLCYDHDGHLPLSIKAVPEGTVVPVHNVLMTIENTCPRCYWLTNFMETLLMQVWYPITVATQSREIKRVMLQYLKKQGSDPSKASFMLHDFGFRGVSSVESAAIGGTAHLLNFMGTDTLASLTHARRYYSEEGCAGFSVPASEHSTITSWGKEHEVDAYRNMLERYPAGIMACVSDSYDIYGACSDLWGGILRDEVLSRDGVLVVRPDSGNPVEVVAKVIKILGERFGVTYNTKGYKVLNPKVRVIQGDGVNYDSISEILRTLDQNDWAAENIAFGMGGALLQKLDRDTQKMAIKCSYVEGVDKTVPLPQVGTLRSNDYPVWHRDVSKAPVTDKGKSSKAGRLALVSTGDGFKTQPESLTKPEDNHLIEVFRDGRLLVDYDLASIRQRVTI